MKLFVLIIILLLVLSVKITWGLLRFCGKLLGACLSLCVYLLIGVLALAVFCLTKLFVPIILIVAAAAIFSGLRRKRG